VCCLREKIFLKAWRKISCILAQTGKAGVSLRIAGAGE